MPFPRTHAPEGRAPCPRRAPLRARGALRASQRPQTIRREPRSAVPPRCRRPCPSGPGRAVRPATATAPAPACRRRRSVRRRPRRCGSLDGHRSRTATGRRETRARRWAAAPRAGLPAGGAAARSPGRCRAAGPRPPAAARADRRGTHAPRARRDRVWAGSALATTHPPGAPPTRARATRRPPPARRARRRAVRCPPAPARRPRGPPRGLPDADRAAALPSRSRRVPGRSAANAGPRPRGSLRRRAPASRGRRAPGRRASAARSGGLPPRNRGCRQASGTSHETTSLPTK
jgi:hypothetical protein